MTTYQSTPNAPVLPTYQNVTPASVSIIDQSTKCSEYVHSYPEDKYSKYFAKTFYIFKENVSLIYKFIVSSFQGVGNAAYAPASDVHV